MISLALLVIFITACSTPAYKYEAGIETYLQKVTDVKITAHEEIVYYLLPLNSCDPCMDLNLNMLSSLPKNHAKFKVIFIGASNNDQWEPLITKIKENQYVVTDPNGTAYDYETGLSKAMLIHISSGKFKSIMNIPDNKVNEAKTYILNKDL